jgi:hypothetical protein
MGKNDIRACSTSAPSGVDVVKGMESPVTREVKKCPMFGLRSTK